MTSWSPGTTLAKRGRGAGLGCAVPRIGGVEDTMTTDQKIISARVGLWQLTQQLGGIRRSKPSGAPAEGREMTVARPAGILPINAEGVKARACCPGECEPWIRRVTRVDERHRLRCLG